MNFEIFILVLILIYKIVTIYFVIINVFPANICWFEGRSKMDDLFVFINSC